MAEPETSTIPRLWREETPARAAEGGRGLSDRSRILLALACVLAVAGFVVDLLFKLEPIPRPYFAPLWITEYQGRRIPVVPHSASDRQALTQGGYFAHMVQDLAALPTRRTREPVVVYVSGHAFRGEHGEVVLLVEDADPDHPRTDLPLRQVLESLRACPARHKLLILDIFWPLADPRLGVLTDDVAASIPAELEAVEDADLLVLCACSPGQVALASEDLGRSVFGYFLEAGLRGGADLASSGGSDSGRITVTKLAQFVQTRVDQWAARYRSTRQTPLLLGGGKDFSLRVLTRGRALAQMPMAPPREYPAWLRDAWKVRDQWWVEERYRVAPYLFREIETALLAAENEWRSGVDVAQVQRDRLAVVARAVAAFPQATTVPRPEPRSLALAVALGAKPDVEINESLGALLKKVEEQPDQASPPGEAEKDRAKLVAEFAKKYQGKSDFDLAWAVFEQAASDARPRPETIRLLDGLLRKRQPRPQYVETLFLRQLAERAETTGTGTWPTETVRRALEVVQRGERSASQFRALPWVRDVLAEAAQQRHNGEVLFRARGYASLEEADQLLARAASQYETLLGQEERIETAYRTLEEALAVLPAYLPYLEHDGAGEKTWHGAAQAAEELQTLLAPPGDGVGVPLAELVARGNVWQQKTELLRQALDQLRQPFEPDQVARLIEQSKQLYANTEVYVKMDALLITPFLQAETRAALFKASRDLARRLLQEGAEGEEAGTPTVVLPDFEGQKELWEKREQARAVFRARSSIALLRLGGLAGDRLQKLEEGLRNWNAVASGAKSATRADYALARSLHEAWGQQLAAQFQHEGDPAGRDRLSRLAPAFDAAVGKLERQTTAAVQARAQALHALVAWLGGQYLYEAQDLDGSEFYAAAALDYRGQVEPPPFVRLTGQEIIPDLTPEQRSAEYSLQLQFVPPTVRPDVHPAVRADEHWLKIDLGTLTPATGESGAVRLYRLPLHVELKPGAEHAGTPRPLGFLVQVQYGGRAYHRKVAIPLLPSEDRLELLLSGDPKAPPAPLVDLRLRPLKGRQPFYLFVSNPGARGRNVVVELRHEGGVVEGGTANVVLGPRQTLPIRFPGTAPAIGASATTPAPPAELAALEGRLQIRLLDGDKKNEVLFTRDLGTVVASPREYVRVTGVRFDPAGPKNAGKNRLEAKLQAAFSLSGPPSTAELVLPPDRIPGLIGVPSGTFRGEVPSGDKELKLFAEKLQLEESAREEGHFYLTVDGRERGFVFRTTFARQGEATTPQEDDQPALRLRADRYVVPTSPYVATIEVDNAPTGASLEVSLGRQAGASFEASFTRKLPTPQEVRIGIGTRSTDGALLCETSVQDWHLPLDVRNLRGQGTLRARLLDIEGNEILTVSQEVLVNDRQPEKVQFLEVPRQARLGVPLTVKAVGKDEVSGISSVVFFVGVPDNGKIPANTPTVPGEPVDAGRTTWSAKLPLPPDRKGPTDIGVQFINKVGLSTFGKASLELVDFDPAKTAPGGIRGTVMEGDIPQANLEVILKDEKGTEKDKATADAGGVFQFKDLPPGKYKLSVSKTATNRKAEADVTVEPGQTATIEMALSL